MIAMFKVDFKSKGRDLKSATVRDFSGGYNTLDSELNLASKFSTRMFNIHHTASNTVRKRYGTRFFADLTLYTTTADVYVVNIEYYNASLIAVMSNGEVLAILADASVTRIWDDATAVLKGATNGWSDTEFASFAQFNGELIICNGVDKPIIVNTSLQVDYLQDLATFSNLNVPICRYVTSCSRFLIMAGDPTAPNRIHISNRDTSGTWFGDADPNDGTYIDVGSTLRNASAISGITNFRDKLIVSYPEGCVLGDLGIYDTDGNHTPDFNETVEQYGAISHRSFINFGDDLLMMDSVGIPSLKRTVFTGTIRPERVSDLIDGEIAALLENLPQLALEDRIFSVYDQREGMFMFFIPNGNTLDETTETTGFAYLFRPSLNVKSWSRFDGWNWTCGARTQQGNVFFGDKDGKLWLYGSKLEPIYADYVNDPDGEAEGLDIDFDWELPWNDVKSRGKTKHTKYLALDTGGTSDFTAKMYIDRLRYNDDLEDTPALETEMVGADVEGFGGAEVPFGGGRNTADERLYGWPAKFKLMKLRFTGSSKLPLEFISITLFFQEGSVYR
jgi:hypothetical protein